MPVNFPDQAGKPYRPSNGTEGMMFEERFCDRCKIAEGCEIPFNAMVYEIESPEYPSQWVFDSSGRPTCKAFESE